MSQHFLEIEEISVAGLQLLFATFPNIKISFKRLIDTSVRSSPIHSREAWTPLNPHAQRTEPLIIPTVPQLAPAPTPNMSWVAPVPEATQTPVIAEPAHVIAQEQAPKIVQEPAETEVTFVPFFEDKVPDFIPLSSPTLDMVDSFLSEAEKASNKPSQKRKADDDLPRPYKKSRYHETGKEQVKPQMWCRACHASDHFTADCGYAFPCTICTRKGFRSVQHKACDCNHRCTRVECRRNFHRNPTDIHDKLGCPRPHLSDY